MIDVHVLTHEGTKREWLCQCLESLRGHPVVVHVVDNAGRSVGEGRSRGYALGEEPFVAYVDSDDYVLPGCFDACLEGLERHRAVVTLEYVDVGGTIIPVPKPAHSVAVYRREDVAPYIARLRNSPHTADWHLRRALRPAQLQVVGYVWRVHPGGDHTHTIQALEKEQRIWQTG